MRRALIVSLAFCAIAACARDTARDAADSTAATTAAADPDVERAVAVYRAVQANRSAAESVLTAHQLTADGFDSLMYEIAADSAKAAAYRAAIQ